jgi:hypothetical protein
VAIEFEGHRAGVRPTKSGRRYEPLCDCGFAFHPPTRATEQQAVLAVIRHVTWERRKALSLEREFRRMGVSTERS